MLWKVKQFRGFIQGAEFQQREDCFHMLNCQKIIEIEFLDFINQGGKERVEEIVEKIRNSQEMDIKLRWCEELGLTNISLGTHFGFDLDEIIGSFQEHNLDGKFSLAALAIAVTYVNELLRIRTD